MYKPHREAWHETARGYEQSTSCPQPTPMRLHPLPEDAFGDTAVLLGGGLEFNSL